MFHCKIGLKNWDRDRKERGGQNKKGRVDAEEVKLELKEVELYCKNDREESVQRRL